MTITDAPRSARASLGFAAGFLALPGSDEQATVRSGSTTTVELRSVLAGAAVSGKLWATLRLTDSSGAEVARHVFPIVSDSAPWATFSGWVTVVLALFVVSYASVLCRLLRVGKRVASSVVGLALLGPVALAVALLGGWLVGSDPPFSADRLVRAMTGGLAFGIALAGLSWGLGSVRRAARTARTVPPSRPGGR